MNWPHRLAIWITDLLCPHLGKAKPQYKCAIAFMEGAKAVQSMMKTALIEVLSDR